MYGRCRLNFKNKNILVYGLGKSGMACIKHLTRSSANLFIYDNDKKLMRNYKKNGVHLFSDDMLTDIDIIIKSPGVDPNESILQKAREQNKLVISEVEFAFLKQKSKNIIAITGTNGKTTVTELVTDMLESENKCFKCGNIGYAFSNYIDQIQANDYVILEVSSFQLEDIDKFTPKVCVITNLAPDHLDRYSDVQDYYDAKFKIFKNQKEHDFLIVGEDVIDKINGQTIKAQLYHYGENNSKSGTFLKGKDVYFRNLSGEENFVCKMDDKHFSNANNLKNLLCAICVCCVLQKTSNIENIVKEFNYIEHRYERIGKVKGVEFVNDSKATNIHATLNAVKNIKTTVHLLLGGSDKGENFNILFQNMPQNVKAYLFGSTANKMVYSAIKTNFKHFKICHNMRHALQVAFKEAKRGEMVLLSPACASFDEFKNFEERGKYFKEWVYALNDK